MFQGEINKGQFYIKYIDGSTEDGRDTFLEVLEEAHDLYLSRWMRLFEKIDGIYVNGTQVVSQHDLDLQFDSEEKYQSWNYRFVDRPEFVQQALSKLN